MRPRSHWTASRNFVEGGRSSGRRSWSPADAEAEEVLGAGELAGDEQAGACAPDLFRGVELGLASAALDDRLGLLEFEGAPGGLAAEAEPRRGLGIAVLTVAAVAASGPGGLVVALR